MLKVNFQDGTKVSSAKVTIDGVDYPVTPARYNGATPLSSTVMNTMQDNIEDAIDQKAASSDVYTKTEIDTKLNSIADSSDVYTKTETDTRLNEKANSSDVYTKTETDTRLNAKANSSDVYTKTETDTRLNEKANSSDVYTKTEIDTKLNTKPETGTELNTNNYFKNAGTHNSLYRGEDITSLFYDGTLSKQIAAGTFDDIYIGDYIIGQVSGRKYLVADINYRLHTGDTECTTPHVLMIPERIMGTAKMNDTYAAKRAYIRTEMYEHNLFPFKTIIENDFGAGHILKHRNYLAEFLTNNKYEGSGSWCDSEIELMNELMVYGSNIFHNIKNGENEAESRTIDKSQLSLFRLDKSKIVARNDNNERADYWLRDVESSREFAYVSNDGLASYADADYSYGVRPAFLIY